MVPLFSEFCSEDSKVASSVKNINKQREVNGKKNDMKDYYFRHYLLKANRIAEPHERLQLGAGKFGTHFPSAYVKLGQHLCITK